MYISNKYTIVYYNIINRARTRALNEYGEIHHIIPRSLGGDNIKDNLVNLTPREHFICHKLLTKMLTGVAKRKMHMAVRYMKDANNKNKMTSRQYSISKEESREYMKDLKTGGTLSDQTRLSISNALKGRPSNHKGKRQTDVSIEKIKKSRGNRNPIGTKRWMVNANGVVIRSDTIPEGFKLGRKYD